MALNLPRNSRYSFEMVGFGDFNETAEAASADSMRPRKLPPFFNETVEADLVVSLRPRKWLLWFQGERR
jgi:hypothetical protein